MRYSDEFRNPELVLGLVEEIRRHAKTHCSFMEVCGGHTMAIHRYGLRELLPTTIKLLSGPGCPVCVTHISFIDKAIAISRQRNVILATFGDLIRVPGSSSTLDKERMKGSEVRVVYSVMDAIQLAASLPDFEVVFLGIGFETTAPTSAAAIVKAKELNLNNFSILSSHKVMPPVMEALIHEGVNLNGYLAPGHVSAITGTEMYQGIANQLGLSVVVSGFEPSDILSSILMLVKQVEEQRSNVEIQYSRVVKMEGNQVARALMETVFEPCDDWWRGFGVIPHSGLRIRKEYAQWDANIKFQVAVEPVNEPKGCICGSILKGLKEPKHCPLFGKVCNPENPVGACMVSNEGSCAAYYKYGQFNG